MRITYRKKDIKNYWTSRWEKIAIDDSMVNSKIYPLKYAEQLIIDRNESILEAGCGPGRILRYYHAKGMNIVGIDFIESVIKKLKKADPTLKVKTENISNLSFDNESFKYILAFGLFHCLPMTEEILPNAIKETYRVLKDGGSICASFRADNIQTKLVDFHSTLVSKEADFIKPKDNNFDDQKLEFHKINFLKNELKTLFEKEGFIVESITPIQNMFFLYKFKFFRSKEHKDFDESLGRNKGYGLSWLGKVIENFLIYFFPSQWCNMFLIIAHKKRNSE